MRFGGVGVVVGMGAAWRELEWFFMDFTAEEEEGRLWKGVVGEVVEVRMLELFSEIVNMAAAFKAKGYEILTVYMNELTDISAYKHMNTQGKIMQKQEVYLQKIIFGSR